MSNKIQVVIAKKEKPYFPFKPSLQWFKEMGIGRKRFNQILRNQTQPTLDEVERLANFFEVDKTDLL